MRVVFETMAEQHGIDVMNIFNYYVEHGFSAYPQTRLPKEFFGKFLEMTKGYPAFIIKDAKAREVIGFCLLRPYNPFPVFKKTSEISYFIKPGYTGKGIGYRALKHLEKEARKKGIRSLLASVSSKNERSLTFHKKNGFVTCGKFKEIGEKNGVTFDVIWMQKELAC